MNAVTSASVVVTRVVQPDFGFFNTTAVDVVLAGMYFNSSIRLIRQPPETTARVELAGEVEASDSKAPGL
ncbi:MAG: hypothetical protein JWQ19_3692 [Subtercola sp.]|nr:hypothetical protein [Subtercola sp.]